MSSIAGNVNFYKRLFREIDGKQRRINREMYLKVFSLRSLRKNSALFAVKKELTAEER